MRKALNGITMYRLMLYYLLLLWGIGIVFAYSGIIPFDGTAILLEGILFLSIARVTNFVLSRLLSVNANFESSSITALILTLIVGPVQVSSNLIPLSVVAIIAMASKYLLVYKKKHIFNPAAFAALVGGLTISIGPTWWVGLTPMLPFILIGGLLVLIKIQRERMVLAYALTVLLSSIFNGSLSPTVLSPAIWFFALVMLVEPLTSPHSIKGRIIFAALVGLVQILLYNIAPGFPFPLSASLLLGNLFTAFITPTYNLSMEFSHKKQIAKNTWAFFFKPERKFNFKPGQYLEWTFAHFPFDSRGTRRFFTIASSPTEKEVMIAIRVAKKGSSFKKRLLSINRGQSLAASSPMGEFVLPTDNRVPLCFIAGGIGVTPFRSMVNHLLETGEKRDIVLLYSNHSKDEVAFEKLFDSAKSLGVKAIYVNTEKDGHLDEKRLKKLVPDYASRVFYLSGPKSLVDAFKRIIVGLGIKGIKTDFFPGY